MIFSREWTVAYTGTVGFGNTRHFADIFGIESEPCACTGTHSVGAGHIGVGTVIDIEHRTLCALE
ncbi:hypothetical protein D3C81_2097200 [compost metagenome]